MSTISRYPSKRPSVKQVEYWDSVYEGRTIDWRGRDVSAKVENGYPFPDFYRVTYIVDGVKKSKFFYGEIAWSDTERFVRDLGLFDVSGRL